MFHAGAAGEILDDEGNLVRVQGFRKRLAVAVQPHEDGSLVDARGIEPGFEGLKSATSNATNSMRL